jgi:CBS domain containing-hemolysin-like protein
MQMTFGADTNQPSTVLWRATLCASTCLVSLPAHASLFKGETLDKVASGLALFVIFVVPIVLVALFWMVHVLPEKIAHKRHHPQRDAIQVLCLLSLFFGGLLWPLAWLWAYSKPVLHKLAYGTDKHDDYHAEVAAAAGDRSDDLRAEVADLRGSVESMLEKGGTADELAAIRDRLAALEPRLPAQAETR